MPETVQPSRASAGKARTDALLTEISLLIEPQQRALLDTVPAEVRHCAGFHMGWWEADGGESRARYGQAIRPALTITSARAAGGSAHDAISAAVAVELMHDFSLLHHDITHGDVTRRHRPTAWVAHGIPMALLTGDTLLVSALDLVPDGAPGATLRNAAQELCAGQSAELTFESRTKVWLPECLRMAQQKTGALIGAACKLGALSARAAIPVADLYSQFGRHIGLAFQLVDDILGIWGCASTTGKPVYTDLKSRKKSLPMVAALSSGTAAGDELAELLGSGEVLDDRALAHAADLVEDAGGRAWAEAEALRHRHLAFDALDAAQPDPAAADDLRALAELMTARVSC